MPDQPHVVWVQAGHRVHVCQGVSHQLPLAHVEKPRRVPEHEVMDHDGVGGLGGKRCPQEVPALGEKAHGL